MNAKLFILKQFIVEAVKRAWLTFSLIFVLVALFFGISDHDNFLTSDDPYIPAVFFGLVCAGLGLVYTISENINKLAPKKHWIAGLCLAGWSLFWIAIDTFTHGEGKGIATIIGVVSLIAGIISYVVFVVRLPKWFWVVISGACLLLLTTYGMAIYKMHMRVF